ncbi:MAG TPA: L-threonylcarbamoyladenylate synthase [Acidimicrobiales bacterium]|nr:L-threonylcarbamoyladenylate synthase [Acidimicrobiales bacterium]
MSIRDGSDPDAVDEAVRLLRDGQVVAVPTDTVYGVAVDPFQPGAADRLFVAKDRPKDVQLPVLIASPSDLAALVEGEVDVFARRLVDRFWPGALTIVLPRRADLRGLDLGGNATTIGVRCPDHRLVRALCREAGPLATTSANRHREPTPPDAAGVAEALGGAVALVLDGGLCEGAPSTVVSVLDDEVRILREGPISADRLLDR